jgi:hypothetical protein
MAKIIAKAARADVGCSGALQYAKVQVRVYRDIPRANFSPASVGLSFAAMRTAPNLHLMGRGGRSKQLVVHPLNHGNLCGHPVVRMRCTCLNQCLLGMLSESSYGGVGQPSPRLPPF